VTPHFFDDVLGKYFHLIHIVFGKYGTYHSPYNLSFLTCEKCSGFYVPQLL